MKKTRPNQTRMNKRAFLAAYAQCGCVTHAARIADVSWKYPYAWVKDDPEFAEAFEEAKEHSIQVLEQECRRRALEGVRQIVYHKGSKCGIKRVFSDTLLMFLLKSLRPSVYRERVDMNTTVDQKTKVVLDWDQLCQRPTDDDLRFNYEDEIEHPQLNGQAHNEEDE